MRHSALCVLGPNVRSAPGILSISSCMWAIIVPRRSSIAYLPAKVQSVKSVHVGRYRVELSGGICFAIVWTYHCGPCDPVLLGQLCVYCEVTRSVGHSELFALERGTATGLRLPASIRGVVRQKGSFIPTKARSSTRQMRS